MDLEQKPWWDYLEEDLQELLNESLDLYRVSSSLDSYHDYSFVLFPASKAYEGFLKKVFFDMGFISEQDYLGTRFRIGKALNPSLEDAAKGDQWVYGKLEKYCGGKNLPDALWTTWKECRNLVFHWFPKEQRAIDRHEAHEKIRQIIHSIDLVFKECKINNATYEKS